MGSGLVAENGFAESVKPAAFSITIRSVLHLLTPDLRESERPGPVASPPVGYRLFLRSYALEKQGISAWRLPPWAAAGFIGVSKGLLYDGFFSLPSPGS